MGSEHSPATGLAEAWREEAKDTICVLQKLLSGASNHVDPCTCEHSDFQLSVFHRSADPRAEKLQ